MGQRSAKMPNVPEYGNLIFSVGGPVYIENQIYLHRCLGLLNFKYRNLHLSVESARFGHPIHNFAYFIDLRDS